MADHDDMLSRNHESFSSIGRTAVIASCLIATVCAALILVEVWRLLDARKVQIAEAQTAASNLAKSAADMTSGTFVQADLVLAGLVERLETEGISREKLERMHQVLRMRKSSLPQLQRLSVLDADGHWLIADVEGLDPTISHAEREYFQYHRSNDDSGTHLGAPIRSKSTNEWIITISRRFNDSHGRFAGVAVASVALSYFGTYSETFDIGQQGTIVLVHSDGTVINRRPFKDDVINSNVSSGALFREHIAYDDHGSAWIKSRFDGVERMTAFHKVNLFPLYAVVSLARDDILAPWVRDSVIHSGAMLVFLVLITLVGTRLIRQSIQRHSYQMLLAKSQAALVETNARLEELAREDPLTGIANRRELDRALIDEGRRAQRRGTSVALLMIDVDHFKAYNDTYGHLEGDACLRQVAQLVRAGASRPGDLAARFGGEEFVVLLPDTDLAGARRVAEKLRSAFHNAALRHDGTTRGIVTASIGVAALSADASRFDAEALIAQADRALYDAKRSGRDVVRYLEEFALMHNTAVKQKAQVSLVLN